MAHASSEEQREKVAVGYPSMDRYQPEHYMFPPHQPQPSPASSPAAYTGYPPSTNNYHAAHYPAVFPSASASYHFPLGGNNPNDPSYLAHAGFQKPYGHPPQPVYPNTGEFFYPQQHYKPLMPDPNGSSSSFGRMMLILMLVLVCSMCMMTLVMWFLFGTYIPEFDVASVKVSNFTVSNATLTGTWEVAISVTNTNKELSIRFDRVMSSIFYREALLGMSAVNGFEVGQMQQTEFNFSMATEQNAEEKKLQGWVLPTLEQDHGNGMVMFSLRLTLKANFTTPNMVYRRQNMGVMCENMQVMFTEEGTGRGSLSPGMGSTCLIRNNDGFRVF